MLKSKLLALAPVAAAVAIAGCGGSSGYGNSAGAATAAPAKATTTAAGVAVASSKLGNILVDAHGRTLYLFVADKGTTSKCYGACASLWPPLTVTGAPKAGTGASASLLGTTKRTDGTTEVTYNGHPLYYYAPDTAAGDVTGQNLDQFGAKWYVLSAKGTAIAHG
jgi:predicted lipoprotein with Yx(FWY)xxD motif